jgi:hypothetical protein
VNESLNQNVERDTNTAMHRCIYLLSLTLAVLGGGCLHVKMDPIQVNAVVDVNVKVEREVAGLLSDIYGNSATIKVPNSSDR